MPTDPKLTDLAQMPEFIGAPNGWTGHIMDFPVSHPSIRGRNVLFYEYGDGVIRILNIEQDRFGGLYAC